MTWLRLFGEGPGGTFVALALVIALTLTSGGCCMVEMGKPNGHGYIEPDGGELVTVRLYVDETGGRMVQELRDRTWRDARILLDDWRDARQRAACHAPMPPCLEKYRHVVMVEVVSGSR